MELDSLNLLLYDIIDALGEFYDVPDDDVRAGMGLLLQDLKKRCLDLKDTWEGCIDHLMDELERCKTYDTRKADSSRSGGNDNFV